MAIPPSTQTINVYPGIFNGPQGGAGVSPTPPQQVPGGSKGVGQQSVGLSSEFEALLKAVGAQVLANACNSRARGVSMPSSTTSESLLNHLTTTAEATGA